MPTYSPALAVYVEQNIGYGHVGGIVNGAAGGGGWYATPDLPADPLKFPSGPIFSRLLPPIFQNPLQNDVSNTGHVAPDLAALIAGSAVVQATLTLLVALNASVTGTPSINARLTLTLQIKAAITGAATVAANLRVTRKLAAAIVGTPVVAARLVVQTALRAAVVGQAVVAPALSVAHAAVSALIERTRTGVGQ
jgi:hypothetical protein